MGQNIVLDTRSITYLEGGGNYTYVHTLTGKKYLVCKTLKTMTVRLGLGFMRVHKSFLVNLRQIEMRNIENNVLLLRCGGTAYVSKRKRKELDSRLRTGKQGL
ncbi:LytR/AlgR family response regulator transcription factor [Dyadobacter sp. BHUBP1]|uniref:LytR/AlgR family response regulator transcription factor n=1 Tax=Dyadobacter sp. BHUBP1 TaxID=3424178 RepID=UPI003D350B2E